VGDFHQLQVWRSSHALVLDIYRVTADFPRHELFGLTSQLRRANATIPANVAEGTGRGGDREFLRFLRMALGSAAELEYQLFLAHELHYLSDCDYDAIADSLTEVKRMLSRLIERIAAIERERRVSDPRPATRDSRLMSRDS